MRVPLRRRLAARARPPPPRSRHWPTASWPRPRGSRSRTRSPGSNQTIWIVIGVAAAPARVLRRHRVGVAPGAAGQGWLEPQRRAGPRRAQRATSSSIPATGRGTRNRGVAAPVPPKPAFVLNPSVDQSSAGSSILGFGRPVRRLTQPCAAPAPGMPVPRHDRSSPGDGGGARPRRRRARAGRGHRRAPRRDAVPACARRAIPRPWWSTTSPPGPSRPSTVSMTAPTPSTTSTARSSRRSWPRATRQRRTAPGTSPTPCPARRSWPSAPWCCCAPIPGCRSTSSSRRRSSTWRGSAWAWTPSTPGCGSSTATAFATEAAGERGPLLVAQCHSRAVLGEIKLAADDASGDDPGAPRRAAAPSGAPRRTGRRGALGRHRPHPRARPPHRAVGAAPGAAGRRPSSSASRSWCGPCGPSAPGTSARPTGRWHAISSKRPTRRSTPSRRWPPPSPICAGTGARPPRGGARRPAVPGVLPRAAGDRGGPLHPGRRGPDPARQVGEPPSPCLRRRRGRDPRGRRGALGGPEEGREGPGQCHRRHPPGPSRAGAGGQAPAQGRVARDRHGDPRRSADARSKSGLEILAAPTAEETLPGGPPRRRGRPSTPRRRPSRRSGRCSSRVADAARRLGVDPETALRGYCGRVPPPHRGGRARARGEPARLRPASDRRTALVGGGGGGRTGPETGSPWPRAVSGRAPPPTDGQRVTSTTLTTGTTASK